MQVTFRERGRAALVHLALSVLILVVPRCLVYRLWYPVPLAHAAGVIDIYYLMLAVDLVLAPALTFLVFKRERAKLIFDLVVIVIVQLSFFFYGLMTVAQGRPEWLVFVVDDFEMVRPVDIDRRQAQAFLPANQETLWDGPRWAAAVYSRDPHTADAQKQDEIFLGISMATRPETFVSLDSRSTKMLERSRPVEHLSRYNDSVVVNRELSRFPEANSWLPMKGIERDMVVLLDVSGAVLGVAPLAPWD